MKKGQEEESEQPNGGEKTNGGIKLMVEEK